MASWTLADIARMRLISQGLITPCEQVEDAVTHLTCTQGQDYPGSTLSLALRTRARALAPVAAAYDAGSIVRSWPMRGTLFVVAAQDLRWMLALTGERILAASEKRRRDLGLTAEDLTAAEHVAREQAGGQGLRRADLLSAWTESGLDVGSGRGYHLIFACAVRGVLCLGPTEGKEQRFVLVEDWIPPTDTLERDEAICRWFNRYVRSHGPVREADFLWWTKLLRRDLAPVLDAATADLTSIEVDGSAHWVDPALVETYPKAKRSTAAPLLLPGFDEIVLGYADRAHVMTAQEEITHVVPGKNGVFRPTLVRAGRAVGTWKRPTRAGQPVSVTPFEGPLDPSLVAALPRLTDRLPR